MLISSIHMVSLELEMKLWLLLLLLAFLKDIELFTMLILCPTYLLKFPFHMLILLIKSGMMRL